MRDRFSGSMSTVIIAALALTTVVSGLVTEVKPRRPRRRRRHGAIPICREFGPTNSILPSSALPNTRARSFFTEAQRGAINKERTELYGEERPAERGTDLDVARAYNHAVFLSNKHVGTRTSLIVDPPDGRVPRLTPEAQKMAAADREFRLALLQATDTCKSKSARCNGGKYDPTRSPRFAELPPRYNTLRMNRYDQPEDVPNGWAP
jgi:hypothetical protein